MRGAGEKDAAVAIGQTLDGTPYQLTALVGRGANAEVWRAEHTKLGTSVVVKLLDAQATADGADRMRLEAQALARLSHPNLVSVTDAGVVQGRLFYVMDDVAGLPLGQAVGASGRMAAAAAVSLIGEVLEGLAYVHGHGLVHRDLHPENVLVATEANGARTVRILDLGLVKLVGGHEALGLAPLAVPTAAGTTLGTPRYMAPEQARGGAVDARTDLYAVGAILYRLVTGRDPFAHHATIGEVLAAQVGEAPKAPRALAPEADIGPSLEGEILRSLAKRPADRHPDARAMSAALRRALAEDEAYVATAPASGHVGAAALRPSWTSTVTMPDGEPASAAAMDSAPTPLEAATRRVSTPTPALDTTTREAPALVGAPTPRAKDQSPVAHAAAPPAAQASAVPDAPARLGPSRGAAIAAFAASWLGVALLTVVALVAARSCGGSQARTEGGARVVERISAR